MTPQKQAFRHDPENGIYGDCFRTVIACLLDLPRDEVPHDHAAEAASYDLDKSEAYGSQLQRMNAWLATRESVFVTFAFPASAISLQQLLDIQAHSYPGLSMAVAGQSRTGCGHYVIACDGKITWDPSLTDAGIVAPDEGHWWLGFIARKT